MKKLLLLSSITLILFITCNMSTFSASVKSSFYPANKAELSKAIDGYLKPYRLIGGEGELIAIIVPHSAYEYSGKVAAYAYKQLTNKSFDTVIVMGPSHYGAFDGISILSKGEYETPLGKVKIDEEMAAKLAGESNKIVYVRSLWQKEHSVDVQVPFLQRTMNNFKIVPLIFGNQTIENCNILAEAIIKSIGNKRVLLVASTDLSHDHTSEVSATMDAAAIDAIAQGDVRLLSERLSAGECEMCGYGPVGTAMLVADRMGANSYEILEYSDTGDVTGEKTSVGGYLSAAIYKRPLVLDETSRQLLLDDARKTLTAYLTDGTRPQIEVYEKSLQLKAGVFVTLNKDGQLRGAAGYIKPAKPLYLAVQDMAIAAATQDARFTAVTTEELPSLNIEISVLSPLTKISSTQEVIVGKHGLMIVNGTMEGILLPQAAIENKWTRQQFLENICIKAGLPTDALMDPNTRLYIFTADVFREEEQ